MKWGGRFEVVVDVVVIVIVIVVVVVVVARWNYYWWSRVMFTFALRGYAPMHLAIPAEQDLCCHRPCPCLAF